MEIYLLLVGAGVLAGSMNAVAGGGSFISFPALVFAGVPSVTANASSTVALFPGAIASVYAYRKDAKGFEGVSFKALFAISVVCGGLGALLLLMTPTPTFDRVVPWLLLVATLAFTFGQRIGAWLRGWVRIGGRELLIAQAFLGLYAGYFGGGVGIMMLATWSLMVTADIKRINPTRMVMVAAGNAAAVVCFIVAAEVRWPETLCVLVGAVVGGYVGASVARRAPAQVLRATIVTIAWGMTATFFYRAFVVI